MNIRQDQSPPKLLLVATRVPTPWRSLWLMNQLDTKPTTLGDLGVSVKNPDRRTTAFQLNH